MDCGYGKPLLAIGINNPGVGFELQIWDLTNNELIHKITELNQWINDVCFSNDCSVLSITTNNSQVHFIEINSLNIISTIQTNKTFFSSKIKDNKALLIGSQLEVYDYVNHEIIWKLLDYSAEIEITDWEYSKLNVSWNLPDQRKDMPYVTSPAWGDFYHDSDEILITGNNCTDILLADLKSNMITPFIQDAPLQVLTSKLSVNCRFLNITGSIPDGDFLFDLEDRKRIIPHIFSEQKGGSECTDIGNDNSIIARGFSTGIVLINDLWTGKTKYLEKLHRGRVSSIAFCYDGKVLCSAGEDGRVYLITKIN